jgi:dihydrofolate reductase
LDTRRPRRRLAGFPPPAYKFEMNNPSSGEAAAPAAVLELVVAVAENDVIGRGNQLPWHLPADLRHFKSLTLGKPVLMGRKTYESIGKALPGRTNIVLSRSEGFAPADCVVVKTLDDARSAAGAQPALMVIGGAEIYRQCLPLAGRIHLTLVHARIEDGDTVFTGWRGPEWDEASRERHESDDKNALAYSFITLERTSPRLIS